MQIGTVTRHGHSLAVVVPKAYAHELGWLPGHKVELSIDKAGALVLTALENIRALPPRSRRLRELREGGYA